MTPLRAAHRPKGRVRNDVGPQRRLLAVTIAAPDAEPFTTDESRGRVVLAAAVGDAPETDADVAAQLEGGLSGFLNKRDLSLVLLLEPTHLQWH